MLRCKDERLNLGKLLGKYFAMSLTVATFVAISPALFNALFRTKLLAENDFNFPKLVNKMTLIYCLTRNYVFLVTNLHIRW